MKATLADGWVLFPYSGDERARVEIAVNDNGVIWRPAFLDYHQGERVAKVRSTTARDAWLRVDGVVVEVARLR